MSFQQMQNGSASFSCSPVVSAGQSNAESSNIGILERFHLVTVWRIGRSLNLRRQSEILEQVSQKRGGGAGIQDLSNRTLVFWLQPKISFEEVENLSSG